MSITVTSSSGSAAKSWIPGLIFLLVGVGVAIYGWINLGRASASESWPTVEGSVVSARIDESRRTERRDSGSRRTRYTYTPRINYQYTVEGRSYSASRVGFSDGGSSNRSSAQAVLDRYPVGQAVTVHYDPADPSVAALEPGVTFGVYIPLGIGVLFALVGAGLLVFYFVRRSSG